MYKMGITIVVTSHGDCDDQRGNTDKCLHCTWYSIHISDSFHSYYLIICWILIFLLWPSFPLLHFFFFLDEWITSHVPPATPYKGWFWCSRSFGSGGAWFIHVIQSTQSMNNVAVMKVQRRKMCRWKNQRITPLGMLFCWPWQTDLTEWAKRRVASNWRGRAWTEAQKGGWEWWTTLDCCSKALELVIATPMPFFSVSRTSLPSFQHGLR